MAPVRRRWIAYSPKRSSNRLDTALSMLTVTNMRPQFVEYFTGVTNQLLSSGQPLPWINVGTGGN